MKKITKYIKKIVNNPKFIILFLDELGLLKISDREFLELRYEYMLDEKLDLQNPKRFNEKIQWLKLYDRKKEYIKMVDKYESKNYVSNILGMEYIIPTLGIYDSFDKINFDKLPNQFVIKCTHDSGGLVIVKDKSKLNIRLLKKQINKYLKKNYYLSGREWPYKSVRPRIIVEKYMGDNLCDYKLFTFNGKTKYILTCSDRQKDLKETFFDLDWNIIPLKRPNKPIDKNVKKPNNLNLMIKLANKLSKGTSFVRVDFYEINNKIFFGELTFFPASGFEKFEPDEWDYKLGKLINLNEYNNNNKEGIKKN